MSWTKRQIVNQSFEEVGLAAYVFDLTAEQIESAVRRLNSMMALWDAKGIKLGFPITGIDPDVDTGLPDHAIEAVYLNLGIKNAPSFGKMVAPELKIAAKSAYDQLLIAAAFPAEQQVTGLPAGAGHKWPGTVFLPPADTSPLGYDPSNQLIFGE